MGFQDGIGFCERNSSISEKRFRFKLAIRKGNGFHGILGTNILKIPSIHAENAM
jgi:hypothetical protein